VSITADEADQAIDVDMSERFARVDVVPALEQKLKSRLPNLYEKGMVFESWKGLAGNLTFGIRKH
jgi:hypothetical protein